MLSQSRCLDRCAQREQRAWHGTLNTRSMRRKDTRGANAFAAQAAKPIASAVSDGRVSQELQELRTQQAAEREES